MEPVTGLFLGFMFFMNVAQENKIVKLEHQTMVQQQIIEDLEFLFDDQQKQIDQLNLTDLRMAGSIAAVSANSKTTDQSLKRTIDNTIDRLISEQHRINYLDEMMKIYHP